MSSRRAVVLLALLVVEGCALDGDRGGGVTFPFDTRTRHGVTDSPEGHTARGVYDLAWDIDCAIGDAVGAIYAGVVTHVDGGGGGYGLYVEWETDDGLICKEAHASATLVAVGQRLEEADILMLCGNSGNVIPSGGGDGSHVHVACADASGADVRLPDPGTWSVPAELHWPSVGGTLEVLAPALNEVLVVGEESTVAWVGTSDDDVHVDLWRNGIACELQLAASEPGTGSIPFAPLNTMGRCIVDGGCGWQVGVSNDLASAFSDEFCISPIDAHDDGGEDPDDGCGEHVLGWVPSGGTGGVNLSGASDAELWISETGDWYPNYADRDTGSVSQLSATADGCPGDMFTVNGSFHDANTPSGDLWWMCADPWNPRIWGSWTVDGVVVNNDVDVERVDLDGNGTASEGDSVDCRIKLP